MSGVVVARANYPGRRRAERSNCTVSDQRHVFNLSAVAQTPKFSSRALRLIARNWQVSPILKIRSGTVFHGDRRRRLRSQRIAEFQQSAPQSSARQVLTCRTSRSTIGSIRPHLLHRLRAPTAISAHTTFWVPECSNWTSRCRARLPSGKENRFNCEGSLQPSESHESDNPGVCTNGTCVNALNNTGSFGKIQSDISGTSGLSAGDPRILQFALKFVF